MGLFDNMFGKRISFSDSLKYIEHYRTDLVTDEKGRTRKKTVYIGPWMCIEGDEKTAKLKLFASLALGLIAAGAYIYMALQFHAGMQWLPVSIPKLFALFPLMYLVMGLISLPLSCKPMTKDRYMHSIIRASRSSVAVAAMLTVSLIANGIYRIVEKDYLFLKDDWRVIILCAVVLVCLAVMLRLLYTLDVAEKPNSAYGQRSFK